MPLKLSVPPKPFEVVPAAILIVVAPVAAV
jgi:hypothetical protein